MSHKILKIHDTAFRLPVNNPFIIAMHHLDFYPKGNAKMEPIHYLEEREFGNDFSPKLPWRMYHGDTIPGFPAHPHRGFETVTIVEQGFVDHTDSHGATGRYGEGDVQWMTAGSGMQHCEMFPLVHQDKENTLELFQIWLNLPSKSKMVTPSYKMLWSEQIPVVHEKDQQGKLAHVRVIAGDYGNTQALPPTPDSWAANKENNITIWLIELEPYAQFTIRPTSTTATRTLYCYSGSSIQLEGQVFSKGQLAELVPNESIHLENGAETTKLLLLEGEPINEPIAAYGPFVMNTQQEIQQAIADYRKTHFGGWPWQNSGPINPQGSGRFARYADGTHERPDQLK